MVKIIVLISLDNLGKEKKGASRSVRNDIKYYSVLEMKLAIYTLERC